MLDFPASPALNDTYRDWTYDGEKWAAPAVPGEPPSDDRAYGLKNGVWVPVVWRQRIDISGINAVNVPVPAGAKMMRWMIGPQQVGTTNNIVMMQWSTDGTTFWSGATHYGVTGVFHGTNPNTFGKIAPAYGTAAYVSWTHNSATAAHISRGFMNLTRDLSHSFLSYFRTEVVNASYTSMSVHAFNFSNGISTGIDVKAVRIYGSSGANFAANMSIGLEWIS